MLRAEHISKDYKDEKVIEDISIEVRRGELVSLLGQSGVGKTTLFQILSGLLAPDAGAVFLEGRNITATPGQMSYMQQKDLLLPFEKIIDNVSVPLRLSGVK